ncbi:MAG: hypothetical protein ACOC4M_07690 [Promethearchaeia archaeon]
MGDLAAPWIFVFWLLRAFRVIDFALLTLYRLRALAIFLGSYADRSPTLFYKWIL